MIDLTVWILSSMLMAAQVAPDDRGAKPKRETKSAPSEAADAIEKEYEKLLEDDDAAQAEVDRWIREAEAFEAAGSNLSKATLSARIDQRFAAVREAYEGFLRRHPGHARARLAFGSFLYELHEEPEGVAQWEQARELAPSNPAAWNNLANHYGHRGPVKKAFEYYERAMELDPEEPVYVWNLATTTYLFRRDAMEIYKIDEKAVFDRALDLYRKALKLDPENFILAHDLAQSYYGIKPLRAAEALEAWHDALKLASDDIEREGVYLHLARVELNSGLFDQARQHLSMVTNPMHATLKQRLVRNLIDKQGAAQATNNPPVTGRSPE